MLPGCGAPQLASDIALPPSSMRCAVHRAPSVRYTEGESYAMQASLLTNLLLPLALGIIMLGLGLGLTLEDFRRVARYPRAVLIGLALQILVLPWVAFGLAIG